MLALESSGTALMKELVKKGRGSGMTWTGLRIEYEMDIDCGLWEI